MSAGRSGERDGGNGLRPGDGGSRMARPSARQGVSETAEIRLTFEENRLAGLVFGQYDQNVAHLERRLGVVANVNGNHVTQKGSPEATEQARRVLEKLYERVRDGTQLSPGDVDGVIRMTVAQGTLFPIEAQRGPGATSTITTR